MLGRCLLKSGWGLTDPGYEVRHNGEFLFDHGNRDYKKLVNTFGKVLLDECDDSCRRPLLHMVSLHVSTAGFRDVNQGARLLKRLSTLYDATLA